MAHFRLARLAEGDLAHILATSRERWGMDGMRRYAAILSAAMHSLAAAPEGPLSRARSELGPGLRSFHLRHVRGENPAARVERPPHVIYYRCVAPDVVEIVRVLHERSEPSRHLGSGVADD